MHAHISEYNGSIIEQVVFFSSLALPSYSSPRTHLRGSRIYSALMCKGPLKVMICHMFYHMLALRLSFDASSQFNLTSMAMAFHIRKPLAVLLAGNTAKRATPYFSKAILPFTTYSYFVNANLLATCWYICRQNLRGWRYRLS